MDELQKILTTAESLFRKYGLRSVTMSDIARELGMSKKTLYIHIQNKQDLIDKVTAIHIEQEKQMCLEACDKAKDALDEMLRISYLAQRNMESMNPSIVFDLRKYYSPIWKRFEQFKKDFILHSIISNMERGMHEGVYRQDLDPQIVGQIYIKSIEVLLDDDLFPSDQYPREKLHKEMVMYHIHGILSEKGIKLLPIYLGSFANQNS